MGMADTGEPQRLPNGDTVTTTTTDTCHCGQCSLTYGGPQCDPPRKLLFRIEHTIDGDTFTGRKWITTEDRARTIFDRTVAPRLFGGETARLIGPGGTVLQEASNR